MEKLVEAVRKSFEKKFERKPLLLASPGRINLIGEHTDYNEGFVLPGATDRCLIFAVAPRTDRHCRFYSLDFDQDFTTDLDHLHRSEWRWPDYLQGVLDQFLKAGHKIWGLDLAFGGNVPIGGGMSSSAAVEAGLAFALNHLFDLKLDLLTLALLAQKAENEFVGLRCGIMDMYANLHGRPGQVMKIDCRHLVHEYYPFDRPELRVVISDTGVRRELASSEYNVRRRQCEEGVRILQKYYPNLKSLRDVGLEMLQEHRAEFDPVVWRRCAYVVRENNRVELACQDLLRHDFNSFGLRMQESHLGLRDEYEVSSPELNLLVEAASEIPGVLGSRMMGAGFGGCTISLVEVAAVEEFKTRVSAAYHRETGREPAIHVVRIEAGTRILEA
ncbi:MAG: galactokinase [Candidatus Saccharicenans sp.]|uniref:galactokinase n=1 Tax=Candidatus Saccharicenans sp. TaxID=2819258 RepID=UPI00404B5C5D